jgi:hypothetical protein
MKQIGAKTSNAADKPIMLTDPGSALLVAGMSVEGSLLSSGDGPVLAARMNVGIDDGASEKSALAELGKSDGVSTT